jgi:hypothetical protein
VRVVLRHITPLSHRAVLLHLAGVFGLELNGNVCLHFPFMRYLFSWIFPALFPRPLPCSAHTCMFPRYGIQHLSAP